MNISEWGRLRNFAIQHGYSEKTFYYNDPTRALVGELVNVLEDTSKYFKGIYGIKFANESLMGRIDDAIAKSTEHMKG